jgi:hypothetical protein
MVSNRNRIRVNIYIFSFILDDHEKKRRRYKCPALLEDCYCDAKFEIDTTRTNIITIFKHIHHEHPPIYVSITEDFINWANIKVR